jgi:hypothetical protein
MEREAECGCLASTAVGSNHEVGRAPTWLHAIEARSVDRITAGKD